MSIPTQLSGFNVIPVLYKDSSPSLTKSKASSSSTIHYLYARPHATSSTSRSKSQLPEGRTLFLVNLPPDTTDRELVLFFKNSGTIEKVVFDFDVQELTTQADDESDESDGSEEEDVNMEGGTKEEKRKRRKKEKKSRAPIVKPLPTVSLRKFRKTGSSAYVIFLDESSLQNALSTSSSKPRSWPTSEEPIGLAHYLSLYTSQRPPLSSVREFADSSMELYEYNIAKSRLKKGKYNKGEAIVDEDGFTLVTRGGAYGKTLGGGVGVATKKFQRSGGQNAGGRTRKKKDEDKEGFYAFQKAEKQRSGLLELKRKWEEDKAKVEKLKASRRFKPY